MSDTDSHFFLEITPQMKGERMDKVLAQLLPDHTRSTIQQWIKQGLVKIEGEKVLQKLKLSGDERIEVSIPMPEKLALLPQNIPLDIVDEDAHLLVLNKPAGFVVHPGAGNQDGTLLNGLLYYCPNLVNLPRAGIVHRLDKNTTGLMVVAKSEQARQKLIEQLDSRQMHRQYLAVVEGVMVSGESIDKPISRNRHDRLKMAIHESGKEAITHVRVIEKYRAHCLLQANLETGRTHQIRVHLSWRGYPIVGDKLYGYRNRLPAKAKQNLIHCLQRFDRQALHAQQLSLVHPVTKKTKTWQCPPPQDMKNLCSLLREDATG